MLKEHKCSCQIAKNACSIWKAVLKKDRVKLVSVWKVTVDLKLKKKDKSIRNKERISLGFFQSS